MMMVGHTHEDIDAMFKLIHELAKRRARSRNILQCITLTHTDSH